MFGLTICRNSRPIVPTLRLFLVCLLIAVLGFYATTAQAQQDNYQPGQQSQPVRGPIHIVPMTTKPTTPSPNSPAATLSYYGGPVMSNIQIIVVYWTSNVDATIQTEIPDYYRGVVDSVYFDLLSEYSTNITPVGGGTGTNQSIGRGSYGGAYTITPSICNIATCTVDDSQIQTELLAQIAAGHLPTPQYDSNGNDDTEYVVYFPPGVTITMGPFSTSCVQFCAYHGTATYNSKYLAYGVVPDFGPPSGCSVGCGSGTEFENVTSVSSHELAESVTDMAAGQATTFAPPLAWYDANSSDQNGGGEIGDICNAQESPVTTPTGTYTVQQLWSNAKAACVTSGLNPIYQLNAPTTATAGTAFNFTLTAQNPAGGGGTDTSYIGTVHFTSSDTHATLPSDYTFVSSDQGSRMFTATLQTANAQSITATDTVNSAITANASVTVTAAPDFSISASPSSVSVAQGSSGTSTITTTALNGFNSAITLSATGQPSGVTVGFSPNPIAAPGSGNSTMTMTVASTVATGTYTITVTGTGGGVTHTTTVSLTVTAAADFSISASPSAVTVARHHSGTSTITTMALNGFNSAITLSASGQGRGVTVSFNPNPIASGSSTSTMTMTVAPSAAVGKSTITVTGTGGGITHTTTVTLTVTKH